MSGLNEILEEIRLARWNEHRKLNALGDLSLSARRKRILDSSEYAILCFRFGVGKHWCSHTLDITGKKFGTTRERVRRIEEEALDKLRDVDNSYK